MSSYRPAFPSESGATYYFGISVREYMATRVLAALFEFPPPAKSAQSLAETMASAAVTYTDALLAELAK